MCGIIGVISKNENVSFEIYRGLEQLQHRGQDAAGILTLDENPEQRFYLVKDSGLVSKVFNEEKLIGLSGKMGIGHVRYPTTEKINREDTQPFYNKFLSIGLAHNGHIVNSLQIRNALEKKGISFESNCDSETILGLLSYYFLEKKSENSIEERIFKSVKSVMEKTIGSYSIVSLIKNFGLLAFRDPYGIRPLVYGKKEGSYGFASESIALKKLGYDDIKDISPGTAIFIKANPDLAKFEKKILYKGRKHCMFEWVYFARATSTIEGISVNKVRYNLGKKLAKLFKKRYGSGVSKKAIVVPVPETSLPSGLSFAEEANLPYKLALEKTKYGGRNFIKPTQEIREKQTTLNLEPIEELTKGKEVIIIDDSIVRGTTAKRIVQMLKEDGKARKVHFLSSCPRIENPCFYGIDIPTKKELIASSFEDEKIRKEIQADSLMYNTLEGLVEAIGLRKEELCLACLNGSYSHSLENLPEIKL